MRLFSSRRESITADVRARAARFEERRVATPQPGADTNDPGQALQPPVLHGSAAEGRKDHPQNLKSAGPAIWILRPHSRDNDKERNECNKRCY